MPEDQIKAWQRDRQGVIVDDSLATKYGWKLGDRLYIQGDIYPVNLELYVRGIFHSTPDNKSVYFNSKYVEEAVSFFKGQAGTFSILAASPSDVSKIATEIDDMFRNSPQPTKAESEKAFGLEFVAMMGNVKAFILSICSAVVFATLLVSANTMAMSIRERTREVAVLKTLGFTKMRRPRIIRERGRGSISGWRTSRRKPRIVVGLWLFARGAAHIFSAAHDACDFHLGLAHLRHCRLVKRGFAFLPRFAGQYCRWTPPHRVKL